MTQLRWRYTTDSLYLGRGVYVDGIQVRDAHGLVFDSERRADAARLQSSGWVVSRT